MRSTNTDEARPYGRASRNLCAMSAAAAKAVTANSKEDDQSDDDKPYNFILKEFAEAVHIKFLSFHFLEVGGFSLSNIMICERPESVQGQSVSLLSLKRK